MAGAFAEQLTINIEAPLTEYAQKVSVTREKIVRGKMCDNVFIDFQNIL